MQAGCKSIEVSHIICSCDASGLTVKHRQKRLHTLVSCTTALCDQTVLASALTKDVLLRLPQILYVWTARCHTTARYSQAFGRDLKCCDYHDYEGCYDFACNQHSLALMEAQAPQGGQGGAANDGSQLLQHLGRGGAHQHIHINYASCHAPAQCILSQNHLHGISVEHKYAMAATICSTRDVITRYMQIVAGCCSSYRLCRTNLVNVTCRTGKRKRQWLST